MTKLAVGHKFMVLSFLWIGTWVAVNRVSAGCLLVCALIGSLLYSMSGVSLCVAQTMCVTDEWGQC